MIQAHTTILRGLLAPALVLLAACSGTSGSGSSSSGDDASPTATPTEPAVDSGRQDPQGRQDPTRTDLLLAQYLEDARAAMLQRRYSDALADGLRALEYDPLNDEARDIVNRVQDVLGEQVDNIGRDFDNLILKDRFAAERQRYRAREEMQLGEALWDQGRYGAAEERFENALRILRTSYHFGPDDPLRLELERRMADLADAKRAAIQADASAQAIQGEAELEQQLRAQRIARDAKVNRLLADATLRFQQGNYAEAVARCDEALALQPTNESARELRDLADQGRHAKSIELFRQKNHTEWARLFQDLKESNTPQTNVIEFDLDRWAEVSQRQPVAFTPPEDLEDPETRAVIRKLEETELEHRIANASVQDWKAYYQTLTEVTFYVSSEVLDMNADNTTLTDFQLPRMSVARALDIIRDKTGVAWTVRFGVVHLVAPENARGAAYLHPYNVKDLVNGVADKKAPELSLSTPGDDGLGLFGDDTAEPEPTIIDGADLEGLILDSVAPEAWDDTAFLSYQNGVLLVTADATIQKEVADLLAGLRRHVGIMVDIEARFLKVEDNFLEDVGVDFRGLGNQAAEGVAGRGLEQNNRSNLRFDDFGQTQQINAASPGSLGTGTEPGIFYDDGQDGDIMGRTENLFDRAVGATSAEDGLTNSGGLSVQYTFLDDTEVEVVLRAVAKKERSEEIEAPRLLVFNNNRANMSFLRNISYIKDFEVEIAQAAAVANPVIDVVREGVALDVRPVVDANLRFITMELRPTVMTLQVPIPTFTTTLGVGQPISIQLPRVTLQRVRTTVTMPDGGTMMLGGMKLVEKSLQRSSVPILGDLPLLSFFFSRQGQYNQNRKIVILLRAKIILMDEHMPEMDLAGR